MSEGLAVGPIPGGHQGKEERDPHYCNKKWVVVKIMVPFWIPIIIRHLICRVPRKGP